MKIETKKENSKFIDFLNFPKRLNLLSLVLIVTAYSLLIGIGISCAIQDRDYIIVPEFEEMSYSSGVNNFIKLYSNYQVNSGDELKPADEVEVYKKDAISLCYYGIDGRKTTSLDGWITALYDDGSILYYNQQTYNNKSGIKTGVKNLETSKKQDKYPTNIYCDISYMLLSTDENSEDANTEYNVKFQIKFLQLTKADKNKSELNDFTGATYVVKSDDSTKTIKIFNTFSITSVYDDDEKVNKISAKFTLNSEAASKYIFNFQLFAVDEDDKVYNLMGYYNLSNNTLLTYSNTSKVSRNIDVKYVYAKGVYTDETGVKHELFYKSAFNKL